MNRDDLRLLQSFHEYPSVSILMPTQTGYANRDIARIHLKDLVREVETRLAKELTDREAAPVLGRLTALVDGLDLDHLGEGLAVFANADYAKAFTLLFTVAEQVAIDPTFETRVLVRALNQSQRYWVLALSEKSTRLFEGLDDRLLEVRRAGFPLVDEEPGGDVKGPGAEGLDRATLMDEFHRHFFRQVDSAFARIAQHDKQPLIVAGVVKYLSLFRDVTRHANWIASTLEGNYDHAGAPELAKETQPLVKGIFEAKQAAALRTLEAAVDANAYVSGSEECWRMAREGRGRLLLVEDSFQFPARETADGGIELAADAAAPGVIDDAVDEIIEQTLQMRGEVTFVPDGALRLHGGIALVLRY
ncbi:MAG TPA: hypothetical protein VF807_08210 [Ktedonobacterales bacterium]